MNEEDWAKELAPYLLITINGVEGKFRAFRKVNQWALMASAAADRSGNQTEIMAANYNVAISSVLPSERDRFNRFMMENGDDVDDLSEIIFPALSNLWAGETMLPLERESTDGSTSTSETSSSSTLNSSDVELEPVTIPDEELDQMETTGSSSPAYR